MRKERFAVRLEGLVAVPSDDVYRFVARADDGVRVEVDGEKVLEDDGEHEARESSGEIALGRGGHRVRIDFFQGTEGMELAVEVAGRTLPRAPLVLHLP
jgi:hexosaminidase